ncbi:hypothetical protein I5G72_gp28 [Mycobacterium phage Collard]|uniref:Uncharacterized protein n=1 Tax=Mycobacterium phage Collard TaxID=2301704 RepID=A0A385DXG0_9CAUD|nr:hypothetical protein I5G72_gp28 [Mycobacterium phage Collard]AXQ63245.1 hypothetical protein SEA_COLLARD_71 [Mycobacterium phage Collard]
MNVAEQYPAHTDHNGVTWFRPARDPGTDFSQWGWTSQREQAHPDYRAHDTRRSPHTVVHTGTGETAQCAGPAGCLPCHVAEKEAPVQAKAEERADTYGRALSQLFELAATIDDTQGALW